MQAAKDDLSAKAAQVVQLRSQLQTSHLQSQARDVTILDLQAQLKQEEHANSDLNRTLASLQARHAEVEADYTAQQSIVQVSAGRSRCH